MIILWIDKEGPAPTKEQIDELMRDRVDHPKISVWQLPRTKHHIFKDFINTVQDNNI